MSASAEAAVEKESYGAGAQVQSCDPKQCQITSSDDGHRYGRFFAVGRCVLVAALAQPATF